MSSPRMPNSSTSPMRRPAPTIGQLLPSAVRSTAMHGIWLLGAWYLFRIGWNVFSEKSPFDRLFTPGAFVWAGIVLVVLFLANLIRMHRPTQDRLFTFVGFAATFFALAMVVVFFVELTRQAGEWFQMTPGLIQTRNQELVNHVENAAKARIAAEKQVRSEMEIEFKTAADDKERQEIRQEYETVILPNKLKDMEITEEENRKSKDVEYRQHADAFSILWFFLTNGPSHLAQDAGIYPALVGSIMLAMTTLVFAVPLGVGAAIYLEEYGRGGGAATKALQNIIQVNINNLSGVPSVVYGIFGAAVFVDLIFRPLEVDFPWIAARNALGGGMTLALLTLPVVIVASQEAIRSVPDSIRQGAYALGATRWQTIWRQVLPMASPGILTGTILSLSRAIGEAAPLVLFGALLFVSSPPGLFSRFTVLPMQIFGWSDRPAGPTGRIWQANAAVASLVLLAVLMAMNGIAIYFRNKSQQKMRA